MGEVVGSCPGWNTDLVEADRIVAVGSLGMEEEDRTGPVVDIDSLLEGLHHFSYEYSLRLKGAYEGSSLPEVGCSDHS